MKIKTECWGCVNLMKERDDDGHTWEICTRGHSVRLGTEHCNDQEYEEDDEFNYG